MPATDTLADPMSFTSYAQHFEDVMLWRALGHVGHGCYVDVGAQHPVIDSVSKAFYERGWRGVHIEPVPEYAELLRRDRPDEVVLQIALSDAEGEIELHVIAETGLSTAVEDLARRHRDERSVESRRIVVPARTLRTALPMLAGREVHWLKIDVEGYEDRVLRGWDSRALRPWIIVVEATRPGSAVAGHASWEGMLTAAGYRFAWFDGLNRYYVAGEHAELLPALAVPPNVFDDIKLTANSSLCSDLVAGHHADVQALLARHAEAEARAAHAEARAVHAAHLASRLEAIQRSRSWRLTAPLRRLGEWARRLAAAARVRALAAAILRRIRRLRQDGSADRGGPADPPPGALRAADLSPRAARIHRQLEQAIAANRSHAHSD